MPGPEATSQVPAEASAQVPPGTLADGGEVPPELLAKAERACLVSQALRAGIPVALAEA